MAEPFRWRHLFPNWRYWVELSALAIPVGGGFWTWIGVSGISDERVAWQFLIFGAALSLYTWWTVAYTSAKADRRLDEVRREARQGIVENAQYHAETKVEVRETRAELRGLLGEIKQQLRQSDVVDAPPIKVAALNSAHTIVEAFLAEDAFTMPYQLIQDRQRFVAPIQPFLAPDELPLPMRPLQEALRSLNTNPPTDPATAIATAKQLSTLSQAIPNTLSGYSVAETTSDVSLSISPPSESSSGAHRPKSS